MQKSYEASGLSSGMKVRESVGSPHHERRSVEALQQIGGLHVSALAVLEGACRHVHGAPLAERIADGDQWEGARRSMPLPLHAERP